MVGMKFITLIVLVLNTNILINVVWIPTIPYIGTKKINDRLSQLNAFQMHMDLINSEHIRRIPDIKPSTQPRVLIQLISGQNNEYSIQEHVFHGVKNIIGEGATGSVHIAFQQFQSGKKIFYALKQSRLQKHYEREKKNCDDIRSVFNTWENASAHGILIPQFYSPNVPAMVFPLMQETLLEASSRFSSNMYDLNRKWLPFDEYTLLKCWECLLIVLRNLHAAGFVHGDLKPENIMIRIIDEILAELTQYDPNRKTCKYLVLIDFDSTQTYTLKYGAREDVGNAVHGSLAYLPLDVLRGFRRMPKDDFFSLHMIMLQLIHKLKVLPTRHLFDIDFSSHKASVNAYKSAWNDKNGEEHKVSEILRNIEGFDETFFGALLILSFEHYEELSSTRKIRTLPDYIAMLCSIQVRLILLERDYKQSIRKFDLGKLPPLVFKNDAETMGIATGRKIPIQYFDVESREYRRDTDLHFVPITTQTVFK